VKHGCQKSFDRFPDPPGEKSHAELCGRIQLLGCRKRSKELHGLNLAPIEPQVFIKNSFACEGFDGTRMALLDAGGLVTNVSFNFLSFVSQMIVSWVLVAGSFPMCELSFLLCVCQIFVSEMIAPFWPDHFPMCVCFHFSSFVSIQ